MYEYFLIEDICMDSRVATRAFEWCPIKIDRFSFSLLQEVVL